MKRQRLMSVRAFEGAEMASMVKKKKAKSTEADDQKMRNEEEEKEGKQKVEENVLGWPSWDDDHDYWPWIGDFVDEQMSWGSVWIPFLDEAFGALYGDVVWDDDIWNLKKEIPNPFQS
ncbi:uncharacterized protein LOC129305118 [Prosopis cineraria]|uniref:uncharacterized protein LOC129305118 n=1 Tax=Prosopis cineraria TaxID=364024 RepID=UPI00241050DF|nr:uncharacterized protein LOC129305118 [Prosopis cineraria]